MKLEPIELKVEVTGLDEAQKKISDFMNHPDVKRYEALMGLTPPIWTNTQNLIDKIEEEFQRGDEKSNQDKELIINLPRIEKSAEIENRGDIPCVKLYGFSIKEIYKILDELGLNNGC